MLSIGFPSSKVFLLPQGSDISYTFRLLSLEESNFVEVVATYVCYLRFSGGKTKLNKANRNALGD